MMNSKRKIFANTIICIGMLFIASAISLAAYSAHSEIRAEKSAKEVLEILKTEIPSYNSQTAADTHTQTDTEYEFEEDKPLPLYVLNPEIEMPVVTVNTLECIGILTIPSLDIELPVIDEWSYDNLKFAPCRYSGSAYEGNFVICAHNFEEHFGELQYITQGDEIIFTDAEGNTFYYTVEFVDVLQPTDSEEMVSDEFDLTLFTCNFTGQERVTVRCMRE